MQRLSIARELKDKVGEGSAYCNIGNAYQDFGKFEEASQLQKKSATGFRKKCLIVI